MARIPRRQGRAEPKTGPSDSSDTFSDRPDQSTDRVIDASEAGLGGGLDQAEEGRLGVRDENIADEQFKKPKP